MHVGIFAKTFEGNEPSVVLKAARQAGYDCVQYNMACSGLGPLPERIDDVIAEQVSRAAQDQGVWIAAISATYNMIHPDLAVRERGRTAFEAIAAQARRMGAGLLTLCTGSCDPDDQWRHHPDNDSSEAWSDLLREFDRLIPIAENHDLFLGVEPELGNVISSAQKARTLLGTLRSDRVKIVLDPANLFELESAERRRAIVLEAVHLLGDSIVMAHAKDRRADGSFAAVGDGAVEFAGFFDALSEVGFDGPVMTHGLSASEAPAVARRLTTMIRSR